MTYCTKEAVPQVPAACDFPVSVCNMHAVPPVKGESGYILSTSGLFLLPSHHGDVLEVLEHSSVVDHLFRLYKVLSLIPQH